MNDDTVITRGLQPLSRAVDGEMVIFHPDRGSYFSLDNAGKRVWELLEQPMTMSELCDTLVEEYDVDVTRCRKEVATLVDQLDDAGLVELA